MHLGLGTAAIGRPQYINIKSAINTVGYDFDSFKNQGLELLNYAYDMGIRYFDTAPGYGLAEELLIDWVSNNRDKKIEVATKWGYTYTANFDSNATLHEVKEHSLDKLNEQWEQSKRLLPFLSTYQIHSATFKSGVLDNMPVLNRLVELKADYGLRIGITTSGPNQLEVLKKALEVEVDGLLLFDAFQVTYNILDQSIAPLFKHPALKNKRVIIKEALANGRIFPNNNFGNYRDLYDLLELLAGKYGVQVDAIALRFCEDSVNPFTVLSGVSEKQHLIDNLKATQFELSDEDMDMLRKFKVSTDKYWDERSSLVWN